jgi:ribosomal protein S18 acetylase RimI-like enzyme
VSVEIREATPADEELVVEMMREFYLIEHLPYDDAVARRALRGLLSDRGAGVAFIVRDAAGVAGYLVLTFGYSLEFHGRDALVDELYVREPLRGRGLGSALIASAEALCRAEGIRAMHLEVDRSNEHAKRLYHRAGYRDHDRHLLTKWVG